MIDQNKVKEKVYQLLWELFGKECPYFIGNKNKRWHRFFESFRTGIHAEGNDNPFSWNPHPCPDEWTILMKILPTYINCKNEHCVRMFGSDIIDGKEVHQVVYKGIMYYPIPTHACEDIWEAFYVTLIELQKRPDLTFKWGEK